MYEHDESVKPNTLNISYQSQHTQLLSITQYTDHDERYKQFTLKSDWVPHKQSKVLERFIENVENDIASFQPERIIIITYPNLRKSLIARKIELI